MAKGIDNEAAIHANFEEEFGIPFEGFRALDLTGTQNDSAEAIYNPDKYLLFFKAGQADAMTACFSEYSRKVLNKSKSRRIPIRDQLKRASKQLTQERLRPKERVQEVVHADR